MKRLVWLGLVAVWLVAAVSSPRATYAAGAARGGAGLAIKPDPCGYRYAAWPVVQASATLVDGIFDDEYSANIQSTYLELKTVGLRHDYGNPSGAEDIQLILQGAMDSAAAVQGMNDSGASPYDIQNVRSAAQDGQRRLWQTINGICGWKGKARTWTGWQNLYGYQSRSTPAFDVSGKWSLRWAFQCPPRAYGGTDVPSGNFIVNVRGGKYGSLGQGVLNELDTDNSGTLHFSSAGTYSLQIISECAWHVTATR